MTIYRMIHAGEMPAVLIGHTYRVRETALAQYLEHGVLAPNHFLFEGDTVTKIPFRPGDYVVADEPFNDRREGIVKVINGPSIGRRSSTSPTPATSTTTTAT
jgi:hypothetical protein